MIRIGIIGLSVHSEDYTRIINRQPEGKKGCRVTMLHHPPGNPDVEFREELLTRFSRTVQDHDVKIVGSTEEMLPHVDCVMLLTNDGRPHLREIRPVLEAGKPVYVDKPMAESLKNVVAIFAEAEKLRVPVFTSSPLRYMRNAQLLAEGAAGRVLSAHTYGPAPIQPAHADLFWDGIHGVELLFTVMGPGCKSVTRIFTQDTDVVTGVWQDGRTGVFRGLRAGRIGFGGTVFGSDDVKEIGKFDGYEGLVDSILTFFQTGNPPVTPKQSIEIYAFMHAADISRARGGIMVDIETELKNALKG